jgi:acyl carrier protein
MVVTTRYWFRFPSGMWPAYSKICNEEEMVKNEDKVKQIIADQLLVDVDEVTPECNLMDDLGADSLDVIELVTQFEDAFDIEIADEDVENMKTVKDVFDYIETKA